MKLSLKTLLTLVVTSLIITVPGQAEFLSPLAGDDKHGCSLANKVHRVTTAPNSEELTSNQLKNLKKKLKRQKENGNKQSGKVLRAVNKCISGKLVHLDPCGELGLIAGGSSISPQVINGLTCDWENSPIVKVIATFADNTEEKCTGVAVSEHVVLTAQHCIAEESSGLPAVQVDVYLDSFEDTQVTYEPDDIIADPAFFDGGSSDIARYDIAALAFINPLPVSRTAELLSVNAEIEPGEQALFAGFGRDETGAPAGFDLIAGFLPVDKDKNFSVALKYRGLPGESGACQGDSGGPLLIKRGGEWKVAGVASFADSDDINDCFPPNDIGYTKHSDCDVRELFVDFLCDLPYHDPAAGECIFKSCQ